MKVFLDMDGVIVDFMNGAHEFHGIKYDPYPYPVNTWGFVKYTGMTDFDFWDPLDSEFWENLNWTPDGLEIFNTVRRVCPLSDMALLSAPNMNIESTTGKIAWIRREIPQLMKRTIITNAKEMCAHPNALLIDDADHNVDLWRANGGVAILVPRIWNSRHAEADNTVEILRKEIRDASIGSVS